MKIPSIFKIKTAEDNYQSFPLYHEQRTTTDFFRMQPICCREMVKGDKFTAISESFGRFTPMPFPTLGSVRFINRFFFVPYRTIMEGFNSFITDAIYPTSGGNIKISSVPYFHQSDLFTLFTVDTYGLSVPAGHSLYFRKSSKTDGAGSPLYVLVTGVGKVALFSQNGHNYILSRYYDENSRYYIQADNLYSDTYNYLINEFGSVLVGTIDFENHGHSVWTTTNLPDNIEFDTTPRSDAGYYCTYEFEDFDNVVPDFFFNNIRYRFTRKGKIFYSLLRSLGYQVNFSSVPLDAAVRVSAGKLLAFYKVYNDYYRPSQYDTSLNLDQLFVGAFSSGRRITVDNLAVMSDVLFASYEHDYFTSAWDNPNAPNGSVSSFTIHDINRLPTGQGSKVSNVSENLYSGVPFISSDPGDISQVRNLTNYILDSLKSLQDFLHRNQLSGFRPYDRYLARYGVKLSDDRTNRAYYLGSQVFDTEIKDVVSTSETKEGVLGDYAGKGIAYGQPKHPIKFDTDEYGFFIAIQTCVPDIQYVQGIHRENFHLTLFDFHQSEFDNLGTQPIRLDEIFAQNGFYNPRTSSIMNRSKAPDSVFGFIPRYAEYKVGYSTLGGDFAVPSHAFGLDAYHLARLFDSDAVQHDLDFCIGENDQYDRIFNNTDPDYDHIIVYNTVHINAQRQMKSISEVVEFDKGREIDIPAEGTQLT